MVSSNTKRLEVLAEILVSPRIGSDHVRLVAEIIIADDELTQAIVTFGEPNNENWLDSLDKIIDCVEGYERAWVHVKSLPVIIEDGALTGEACGALESLAIAMHAAVNEYRSVARQLSG